MGNNFTTLLKKRMGEQGFSIDDRQLTQFNIYCYELKEWNTRFNLTSLTDDLDIIDKHFIDSLSLFRYEQFKNGIKVADVGSGAGFPGLPIRIYRQDIQLSLFESVGKKAKFLEHIIARLELENVEVVNNRVEVAARTPEYREGYDLVIARGVAKLPVLAEYCLPLASIGGKFVAYKGHKAELEVKGAESALEVLGGQLERIEWVEKTQHSVPVSEDRRILVFINKVKKTPEQYPRRPGLPQKRPL